MNATSTFDCKELSMSKRMIVLALALLALGAGAAAAQVQGPFRGTVHAVGALSDKSGNPISVTWDRGRITALSDTSITLTRRDKVQVSLAITGSTAVRNGGATYHLADLHTSLVATVVSQGGDAVVIRNIRGEGAPGGADQSLYEGPAAKAITGTVDATAFDGTQKQLDYNRGRIQSLGNGQLTVLRADGQTVTLSYDESTLVRERGGEIGSVDDLKAGEGAMFFSQNGVLELVRCVHDPAAAKRGARVRPAAVTG
jgi:hypothetical protein